MSVIVLNEGNVSNVSNVGISSNVGNVGNSIMYTKNY